MCIFYIPLHTIYSRKTGYVIYQPGSRWDPRRVFNFLRFFERTLYKSNYIIFIFSWCGTHTKIRSKLVVIVTAESQKITLWGPQSIPLGILRVKGSWLSAFVLRNWKLWVCGGKMVRMYSQYQNSIETSVKLNTPAAKIPNCKRTEIV